MYLIDQKDLVDYKKEFERLSKERKDVVSEIERATKKLANEGFVSKAPEKLINEEKAKKEKYEKMLITIDKRIESVKENL